MSEYVYVCREYRRILESLPRINKICPFCNNKETILLTEGDKDISNQYMCLVCRGEWAEEN